VDDLERASRFPGADLRYEMLVAGDAPIEALAAQHTDFDFDHVQPAGVLGDIMELEPAQHPPCFTRGKGVVERARRVRRQIVQDDSLGK